MRSEWPEQTYWLQRLSLDGSESQRLWSLTGWISVPEITAPARSPDGTLIAVGPDRDRIWLVDARNGANRWWGSDLTEGSAPTFVPPSVRLTR